MRMKHTSTALEAGAQENCAQVLSAKGSALGTIAQQPGFEPVLRRKLMGALATLGRDMGIRPATLAVLDALMSFIHCKDSDGREAPVSPRHLLTVYAANETIGFRARGLTDRQLRRHFDVLERKGLIQRRDSANGKRFPIYQGGKVVAAFGLDLSPLFARSAELLAAAATARENQQETRGIVARILQLRRQVLEADLSETARGFVESLRNVTRRIGLTLSEAYSLLNKLDQVAADNNVGTSHVPTLEQIENNEEKTVSDGQDVRHIKQENTYSKKHDSRQHTWTEFQALNCYYPEEPRNSSELQRILEDCAQMLRIDQNTWQKVRKELELFKQLTVMNHMLENVHSIKNPNAYLGSLLKSQHHLVFNPRIFLIEFSKVLKRSDSKKNLTALPSRI